MVLQLIHLIFIASNCFAHCSCPSKSISDLIPQVDLSISPWYIGICHYNCTNDWLYDYPGACNLGYCNICMRLYHTDPPPPDIFSGIWVYQIW